MLRVILPIWLNVVSVIILALIWGGADPVQQRKSLRTNFLIPFILKHDTIRNVQETMLRQGSACIHAFLDQFTC